MRFPNIVNLLTLVFLAFTHASETQNSATKASKPDLSEWSREFSAQLFAELEELARLVDISYCVGTSGIYKPFKCVSRCHEFPDFELVDTFNTGHLFSDSCGYIVLDHKKKRIVVAFRGTYSIANTIADLSTIPQEYVPYPGSHNSTNTGFSPKDSIQCTDCTVHMGFWMTWQNTRPYVIGNLEHIRAKYPSYQLNLVGHSLGGAVAALAALEFNAAGWSPVVTTFGEPRIGNEGLRDYVDIAFGLQNGDHSRYRRVTHMDDPVPLLPLHSWGYKSHAGEIYIAKSSLQPAVSDIRRCVGDEDENCIAGLEGGGSWFHRGGRWSIPIPARYKMWQLFFAHRDYFWRLGLCVPGGDPFDWRRHRYDLEQSEADEREDL